MSNQNFSDEQIRQLNQPLDQKRFKTRQGGGGSTLTYLAGFDIIDTANRILGYGSWGYDIISNELQNVLDENGQIIGAYYAARVRLSVSGCVSVTEEGVCAVQAGRNPRAMIDAHDMARKGAITDAMKRAFRVYGNQFGNPLYDKDFVTSDNVSHEEKPAQRPIPPRPTPNYNSKPSPAPTAAPAPAPTKPKENPLDSLYYKHYSQEFARSKSVKDLEKTVEVMRLEVTDEDILALLRKEYGAAQKRLKELSAAAANELEMAFSEGR